MNEYVELFLNIMLHFIGACIAGIFLFFMIGHAIEQLRALYDKSLWDTREKARTDLGKQIINGGTWFTEDEYKLIKTIGENIVNNNGQFCPSSARDEWRRYREYNVTGDKPITCSKCLLVYSSDRIKCPSCKNTETL